MIPMPKEKNLIYPVEFPYSSDEDKKISTQKTKKAKLMSKAKDIGIQKITNFFQASKSECLFMCW